MKAEQVVPEPVEATFQVTLTRSEAEDLTYALGNTNDSRLWDITTASGIGRELYHALKYAGVKRGA